MYPENGLQKYDLKSLYLSGPSLDPMKTQVRCLLPCKACPDHHQWNHVFPVQGLHHFVSSLLVDTAEPTLPGKKGIPHGTTFALFHRSDISARSSLFFVPGGVCFN